MTRKKWTRLKRQMPQLFAALPSWEFMTPEQRLLMKPVSVKAAIARMHSLAMSSYAEFDEKPPCSFPDDFLFECFNPTAPHPAQEAALQVPSLAGKWTFETGQFDPMVDPAYPCQDYTVVNGDYQPVNEELVEVILHRREPEQP